MNSHDEAMRAEFEDGLQTIESEITNAIENLRGHRDRKVSYQAVHLMDIRKVVRGLLAAHAQAASGEPYGYHFWISNGDGTRSREFARKLPERYCVDWGVTALCTQPPAPSVSVEIDMHWRPLLECMLGVIDEMNDGPMTADQWGEDAALYDQARALIAVSKKS
jgi:hypothetical protein